MQSIELDSNWSWDPIRKYEDIEIKDNGKTCSKGEEGNVYCHRTLIGNKVIKFFLI